MLPAGYAGTFWLKATPHLSKVWVPVVGSAYGDDPRKAVNAFFRTYEQKAGAPAALDSSPMLGYSLVQTIARGVWISGTTDGAKLARALETFARVPLLTGPTTYTSSCHVPIKRSLLILRYDDGKPRSTGDLVRPTAVPHYPC
jgi:branched-chain amino acid transport system substrate-binding protein